MKNWIAILVFVFTACIPLHGWTQEVKKNYPPDWWVSPTKPNIKGLTIGMSRSKVIYILGRPIQENDFEEWSLLNYKGLKVSLSQAPTLNNQKEVTKLEVNDKSWEVAPGIRVGMGKQEIIDLLGEPDPDQSGLQKNGSFRMCWPYTFLDFYAEFWVNLREDKVVEVVIEYPQT